ncbi:hypothetical protein RclHR1_04170002 [Rhizophagus clarus]|nr:hypothetical protein RclHR1_04170002 [Rhizophagus clarus]
MDDITAFHWSNYETVLTEANSLFGPLIKEFYNALDLMIIDEAKVHDTINNRWIQIKNLISSVAVQTLPQRKKRSSYLKDNIVSHKNKSRELKSLEKHITSLFVFIHEVL